MKDQEDFSFWYIEIVYFRNLLVLLGIVVCSVAAPLQWSLTGGILPLNCQFPLALPLFLIVLCQFYESVSHLPCQFLLYLPLTPECSVVLDEWLAMTSCILPWCLLIGPFNVCQILGSSYMLSSLAMYLSLPVRLPLFKSLCSSLSVVFGHFILSCDPPSLGIKPLLDLQPRDTPLILCLCLMSCLPSMLEPQLRAALWNNLLLESVPCCVLLATGLDWAVGQLGTVSTGQCSPK